MTLNNATSPNDKDKFPQKPVPTEPAVADTETVVANSEESLAASKSDTDSHSSEIETQAAMTPTAAGETKTSDAPGSTGFSSSDTASFSQEQFVFSDNKELGFTVDPYGETIYFDSTGQKSGHTHTPDKRKSKVSQSPLILGMILGNQYRLISIAGTGKMGEVWKAFDLIGQRVVALKFVSHEIDNYNVAVTKAKRSFSAIHDLSHQYICPTHAVLEDKKFGYFLVMKWMPNTLDQMLEDAQNDKQSPLLPPGTVRKILSNLADALDYIHAQNIVHRDVKPANIAITRKKDGSLESASLIDFGLAINLDSRAPSNDGEMQISGTPGYMPPEQWLSQRPFPQSDQYAFVATAYELLSGHRVFTAGSFEQLKSRVLHDTPQPIPDQPAYVNDAFLRGLAKNPTDRFPTCRDFYNAIYPPKRHANWLLVAILSVLLLVFIPIKITLFKRADTPPPEKHKIYEPILKITEKEPLAFTMDKECRVACASTQFPQPPAITEEKSVFISNESFAPTETKSGDGWSWSWSEADKLGTLTLTNYESGPIEIQGVNTTVVLPENTTSSITATGLDALYVDGNLTIQGFPHSKLDLVGGLWCRGTVALIDAEGNKVSSTFNPAGLHSMEADTGAIDDGTPILAINHKRIDFLVDSEKSMQEALEVQAHEKTILLTASFETGPNEFNNEMGSFTPISISGHQFITLLSSGNHTITKGEKTNAHSFLCQVEGSLIIGSEEGMGSSTITIDGGSRTDETVINEQDDSKFLKLLSFETKGGRLCKIYDSTPIRPSLNTLFIVRGTLALYSNVRIQNNINVHYYTEFSSSVATNPSYVGAIFVDIPGSLKIAGAHIVSCQGPLTGAVSSMGEVTMSSGVIADNCCFSGGNQTVEGGGVRIRNSRFVMTGGEICNNMALANIKDIGGTDDAKGGGIHGSNGSFMKITSGRICGNVCLWGGGGIYVGGMGQSSVDLSGDVEISENIATLGAGIYAKANIFMSGGTIMKNQLIPDISPISPRGAGVYLKEWNSNDYLGRGPVLALSDSAFISTNNPIYICSNIATGPPGGPFVYIPIQVIGKLRGGEQQRFALSIGTAGTALDNTIRLIAFRGDEFADDSPEIVPHFSKFSFGFWGHTAETNYKFNVLPNPDLQKDKEKQQAKGEKNSTEDLVHYFLTLEKAEENETK